MIFALHEHPEGVETGPGNRVVYDLAADLASFGAVRVNGHALVWELGGQGEGAGLAVEVELDPDGDWVVRCDRIDFPLGGVAYRHVHPGLGIRRLLVGELAVESPDHSQTYRPGDAWFEGADYPVLATASKSEETAFVRAMLLPAEWAGKRTIRYLDPADEHKPKLQHAEVLLETPIEL